MNYFTRMIKAVFAKFRGAKAKLNVASKPAYDNFSAAIKENLSSSIVKAIGTAIGGGALVIAIKEQLWNKDSHTQGANKTLMEREQAQKERLFKISTLEHQSHLGLFAGTSAGLDPKDLEQFNSEITKQLIENAYWQRFLQWKIGFKRENTLLQREEKLLNLAKRVNGLYMRYRNRDAAADPAVETKDIIDEATKVLSDTIPLTGNDSYKETYDFYLAEIHNIKARAQVYLKDFSAADQSCDAALALCPQKNQATLWSGRAAALVDWVDYDFHTLSVQAKTEKLPEIRSRFDQAIKAHQTALMLKPNDTMVLSNYAYALYKADEFYTDLAACTADIFKSPKHILLQMAESYSDKAVAKDTEKREVNPILRRGIVYKAQGKLEDAEKDLLEVLKKKPDHQSALRHLGVIQCKFWKNPQKGRDYLERCVQSLRLSKSPLIQEHWLKLAMNDLEKCCQDSKRTTTEKKSTEENKPQLA